jgi:hypothetical protein
MGVVMRIEVDRDENDRYSARTLYDGYEFACACFTTRDACLHTLVQMLAAHDWKKRTKLGEAGECRQAE